VKTVSDVAASVWCLGQPLGGPHSIVEWGLVGLAVCTVAYAFYKAVRHTVSPGETSTEHVKWRILDDGESPR
jgi:hypothetical protein